jgi:lysophospholipase L1-like esterase
MIRWTIYIFLSFCLLWACKPKEPGIRIFTIGDSTMANKKPEVYPETGWGQVLQNYFDKTVTIKNHAVNGRSTKSFIDEGRWKVILDSLKKDDYVFIQFGHNDQKINDSTRYASPFGTYSENLEKFISETREKGAAPVLFTSIVRRKFDENGKLTDTHGDYPVAVRQVAEKMNVPLIDLQKLTEDWVNYLGDEPSKKMFLWTVPDDRFLEGRKDDTHLSEKGATEVARLVVEECKKKKLSIAKYIR